MPKIRCHFISVISKTFRSIWFIIAMFLFSFLDLIKDIKMQSIPSKSIFIGLGIFLLIILIVFTFNLLRWWKTKIYIEDDMLIVERNQVSQSKTTVKLSGISTVNLQQNIFQRIFDVYTLQLDINSSVTANKTDFNLMFGDEIALEFRDYILKYIDETNRSTTNTTYDMDSDIKQSTNDESPLPNNDFMDSNLNTSDSETIISFSFKEVMRHCILSFSFLGGVYSVALLTTAVFAVTSNENTSLATLWPAIFSLVLAIVPFVYKSLTAFLLYHNFVLEKKGSKLCVSYGLFTRKQFTLPLDKTNAIVIKQPFQARPFNLCYGEIINVGMGDSAENQVPIFCLLVKYEQLQEIINSIAPKLVLTEPNEKSPKTALYTILLKWLFWGILFLIGFSIFHKWWIGAIIIALFTVLGILSYNTKGLNLYENKVSITTGVFDKRTIIIPYSKLQNISSKYGPIGKKFNISKGSVTILASFANCFNQIGYFENEKFEQLSAKIVSVESIN